MLRALLLVVTLTAPAAAQDFESAMETWLDGADRPALDAFASLAAEGDARAQLFLGQISSAAQYWPHEIASLPRKERIALMRAPGGLSGKSWTDIAAEQDSRAAAFAQASRPATKAAGMIALLDLGEVDEVRRQWPGFVSAGDWTAALAVAEHPAAPAEIAATAPALRSGAGFGTEGAVGSARLGSAGQQILDMRTAFEDPEALARQGARLSEAPEVAPFRDLCQRSCAAEEVDICVGAMWSSASGDPLALAGSPVEGLLSNPAWRQSARAADDAGRAIALLQFAPLTAGEPLPITRLSACAWDAVRTASEAPD
ncbi:hypothetical protein [Jannaschia aquimarina]|uniref:Uncharacterized protein n=1 Tax=Jannaschia aquimarina TaxID=935700 RepID=A0A0D1EJA1_9RHOB|nr:hypothetical protein [Jannaschia aquimarina]KIT15880.1 hypothetical protein jaqu_21470 [Jannaschia aquimarina]SNS96896.1 hypothetical protein SAMN05421775_10458 [Jannaschia aquimarina]